MKEADFWQTGMMPVFLYLFEISLMTAPPKMSTEPISCTADRCSPKKKAENMSAERGSRYPQTATEPAGRRSIEEKYKKQPIPVLTNPRNSTGNRF